MSEVNFNSFKGIRGMNNAAGNSVCDYVNMIPTGDTAITRQGEVAVNASSIYEGDLQNSYKRIVLPHLVQPFTVAVGHCTSNRKAKLVSSHSWNDKYIYYVWYTYGNPTDCDTSLNKAPTYVFEVVDVEAKKVYTNQIILDKITVEEYGQRAYYDANIWIDKVECSWARSTTASSKDLQETFFCDGFSIYVIRENGYVRYFPTPDDERYIESYANGPSHPTQEQIETACDNFSGPAQASCYAFKEFYDDEFPRMEIAFFDNRLAVLYKTTNQLYLSKADPCESLRGLRSVVDSVTYANGYHTWYDCANKVAVLWPFVMSSTSTSELAQHIATVGDVLAIINENTTELWTRTGDNSSPITSTVGSVIPFGSSVKPLLFAGKIYLYGKDSLGSNVLLTISPDGSTNVVSNVEVSKHLEGTSKLLEYRCNNMEHILCVTKDDSSATEAMAYCLSNGTWWRYKDTKTYKKSNSVFDFLAGPATVNFYNSQYTKYGWFGRLDIESSTFLPEVGNCDSYFLMMFREQSGKYYTGYNTQTFIVKYDTSSEYNGSVRTGSLRYDESLTECFTTFSKRAIISSVALRESTNADLIYQIVGSTTPSHVMLYSKIIQWVEMSSHIPALAISETLLNDVAPETESLQVSYDRGKTFNTAKTRSLNGGRNDKEIIWRGLGSGNSMTLKFTHASQKPTQIYAIDINIQ